MSSKLFRRKSDSVMPKDAESADEKVKDRLKTARTVIQRPRIHTVSGAMPRTFNALVCFNGVCTLCVCVCVCVCM